MRLFRKRILELLPIAGEALVEDLPDPVLVVDTAGRIVLANPAATKQLFDGHSPAGDELSKRLPKLTPEASELEVISHGRRTVYDVRRSALKGSKGKAEGELVALRDVTTFRERYDRRSRELDLEVVSRRAVEDALKESELQFGGVIDHTMSFIGVTDLNGKLLRANRTSLELIGREDYEVLEQPFWETPWWAHSEQLQRQVREAIERAASGETVRFEVTHPTASGDEAVVDFSIKPIPGEDGSPLFLVHEGRDVTELRDKEQAAQDLEAQLFRVQRLESLGRLAGGVAHDFNNLLTVIFGSLDLLKMNVKNAAAIASIEQAAQSASRLTQQLLAFGKKQPAQIAQVDVREVVQRAVKLAEHAVGGNVRLVLEQPADALLVKLDSHQMEQALLNLAVNARDAMPDGGILTFRVRGEPRHSPERVVLEVEDTGLGMDEAIRSQIFEPFFTTKLDGRGTGLGLSLVHTTVQQCGGQIEVSSEPHKGTLFRLEFPMPHSHEGGRRTSFRPGPRERDVVS